MDGRAKVTLQDIADMAGVSRNTVSKILNGRYTGTPRIRNLVLELMRENNYKGLGQRQAKEEKWDRKTILLLSCGQLVQSGFFLPLVNEIQRNVESRGYVLMFYGIREEELKSRQIPEAVAKRQVDGIVCLEILCREYIEKLISCHIPAVFMEFCHDLWSVRGKYDIVLVSNEYPVYALTSALLESGCTRLGFVGDYRHCRGFYERYQGFCNALRDHNCLLMPEFCINYADAEGYGQEGRLRRRLKAMPRLPEAFVAANDSIAMNLMIILQEWGVRIPQEVQVVSFDNIPESALTEPGLTTVGCSREALSRSVVECLLQRMANPERTRSVVYVDSEIVYRQSAR